MTVCPVCADPASDDTARCDGCGWQLRSGPFLGWVDAAQLEEFERGLERVAAARDLTAAARSGATRAEAAALGPRGGAPAEAAWAAATAEAAASTTPAPHTEGALLAVLTRLTNRASGVLHFIGISCEQLAHQRVVTDAIGFPVLDGAVTTVDWSKGTVSADPLRRRFELAGGLGARPVDRLAFDKAIEEALWRLDDGECVVVAPAPGWTLLDRARAVVQRRADVQATIAAGADAFDLAKLVRAVLETAPLPCDYDVVLQRVQPGSGLVELETRTLFSAGTRVDPKGTPPTRRVTVHGSPVGNDAAAIPVVARAGRAPEDWRVLALGRTNLPPWTTGEIEISLRGLTDVRISREGVPVSMFDGRGLGALLATIPQRVSADPPLDLVCAVELAGTEHDVRERLAFVERLVELVDARQPQPDQVRFGAIGYVDHLDRRTALHASNPVVFGGLEPGPLRRMRSTLAGWRPYPPLRDAATAMEDALAKAAGLHWRRSATADRVLLLVGRRPPSVPAGSGPIPACPHRMDWRDSVRRLRERRVRIVGVWQPGPVTTAAGADGDAIRAYAAHAWHALAGSQLFALDDDTPEAVMTVLTLRSDIPADAFPLGLAAPVGVNDTHPKYEPVTSGERTPR